MFATMVTVLLATAWGSDTTSSNPLPLPIAHRGLLRDAPENTLPAFASCLELRLGIELDIRKSRDGQLVVFHDSTLDRTTNGKGPLHEKTLAELKKLDAGNWFAPEFAGTGIPTLDEVFDLVKRRGHVSTLLLLDLKMEGIEAEVVHLAKKHGLLQRVVCIGMAIQSPTVRTKLRQADKNTSIAVLANLPSDLKSVLTQKDADWAYLRFVPDAEQRAALRASGKKLLLVGSLFAGHEPANWRKAQEAGADAVLTDFPLECRRTFLSNRVKPLARPNDGEGSLSEVSFQQKDKKDKKQKGKGVALTDIKVRQDKYLYRKAPEGELYLHVFSPMEWKQADQRPKLPVVVFFFGGGWRNGSYQQFVPQAEYFASRGLVAACADYRIASQHKTTPDRAVEDARAALRWIRANAQRLDIDPNKIVAAGGSAGGHLAASTALLEAFDAPGDDTKISCRPNALLLFNPALNLTGVDKGILNAEGKNIARALSPTFGLKKTSPPTLLFYGTADRMLDQGREYQRKAQELGVRAELATAADQPHGFFNRPPWIQVTTHRADVFLTSLGYLKGDPTVVLPAGAGSLRNETPNKP